MYVGDSESRDIVGTTTAEEQAELDELECPMGALLYRDSMTDPRLRTLSNWFRLVRFGSSLSGNRKENQCGLQYCQATPYEPPDDRRDLGELFENLRVTVGLWAVKDIRFYVDHSVQYARQPDYWQEQHATLIES